MTINCVASGLAGKVKTQPTRNSNNLFSVGKFWHKNQAFILISIELRLTGFDTGIGSFKANLSST